jgi:effector-binding domain-containing protein
MMEAKQSSKTKVVKTRLKAKLSTLLQDAGNLAEEIMSVPVGAGFRLAGPQMWTYYGADGQPDTVFDLEISIPVEGDGTVPAPFSLGESLQFKHLAYTHRGSWQEFPQVYCKFMGEICGAGFTPSGVCQEVYLHCDMENPSECVTEIQVGVN